MSWLPRIGRGGRASETAPGHLAVEPVVGAAPGVAALLDGVIEDGSHTVLDLGAAVEPSLSFYSRYARRIRFADLLDEHGWPAGQDTLGARLDALPAQRERPYDLVFAWDVLDRLAPDDRLRLVERLVGITAANARLHLVVRSRDDATLYPLRFVILDAQHMRYEETGAAQPAPPPLLPAEVAHVLAPFRVLRGFTLKGGLREYVAVRS